MKKARIAIALLLGIIMVVTISVGISNTKASAETHTWAFCSSGFFPKHLSDSFYGSVQLGTLADVPSDVQGIYWYDCVTLQWKFWAPGAPGCTLTTLGGGHTFDYMVAVTGACTWQVPLSSSTPTSTPSLTPTPTPTATIPPCAGTIVGGIISSDTTWTQYQSPYVVNSNILVESGVTLSIEPGVIVTFDDHPMPVNSYYIQVDGTMTAIGTADSNIVFTSCGSHHYWGGIFFFGEGSIMEHCIVEYGGYETDRAQDSIALISINNVFTIIKDSVLRFSKGSALYIRGDSEIIDNKIQSGTIFIKEGSPYFTGNEISGGGFYIVDVSSPMITRNDIIGVDFDTYGGGFRLQEDCSPTITYNNIIGNSANGISLLMTTGNPIIEHNNIYDNDVFSVMLYDTSHNFNLPNNWWGTTDAGAIDALIYDYHDDFNLGEVTYHPIATEPIPDAGR